MRRDKPLLDDKLKAEMIGLLPQLRGFALKLTGTSDQADDLVQAACERAIRSLDSFEAGTRMDSWMFRIMHNLFLNSVRDTKKRASLLEGASLDFEYVIDGLRIADSALEYRSLRRMIDVLDEDYRTVLMMVAVEGRSYHDVADHLGVPIGTVTSRLARARLKLREWMDNGLGIQPAEVRKVTGTKT